jgi:hypothetical protein
MRNVWDRRFIHLIRNFIQLRIDLQIPFILMFNNFIIQICLLKCLPEGEIIYGHAAHITSSHHEDADPRL